MKRTYSRSLVAGLFIFVHNCTGPITPTPQQNITQLEQTLEMYQQIYKDDHPEIASTLNNLGSIHVSLGQYQEGVRYLEQSLAMRQKIYLGDHPDVADTLVNLSDVHHTIGESEQGLKYCKKALLMYQNLYQTALKCISDNQESDTQKIPVAEPSIHTGRQPTLAFFQSANKTFFESFVDLVDQINDDESIEDLDLLAEFAIEDEQDLQESLSTTYLWSNKEYTPLHYASEEGRLNMVKLLVEKYSVSPNILTQEYHVSPLQCAAVNGHYEVVMYLVQNPKEQADIKHRSACGESVLGYAVRGRHSVLVRWLITMGLECTGLDTSNNNVLHIAVETGSSHFLTLLLECLSEVISVSTFEHMLVEKNTDQHTPLELAKCKKARSICTILEQATHSKKRVRPSSTYAKADLHHTEKRQHNETTA